VRDQHVGQLVQKRLGDSEAFPVAHRAPHDLPEHVTAPFVARQHAVRDEERHGPQVVGHHARGDCRRLHRRRERRGGSLLPAPGVDGVQDRLEDVGVVVGQRALLDGRDPLQTHTGVDGRLRQRHQPAVGLTVELHEHVVPDLDVAVAVAGRAKADRRIARQVVAAEEMNLGAPAARPHIAHRPEVVGRAEFSYAFGGQEIQPSRVRVVVARDAVLALEDRRVERFSRQRPLARQQLPGESDGVVLEVVAEGEVAEHLEERVVAQRRPDVVEVVVLAAHPHALLRRRRARVPALLAAQEHVLELVHPGVGEEQRRVAVGDQRRAGDDAVAVALEVLEEGATKL
jgi:hypothetical protein